MARSIEALNPVQRGWMYYFQHTQGRTALEALDVWVRHRLLRVIAWRQWKRPRTRESRLRALGIDALVPGNRASKDAGCGGMREPVT